MSQKAKNTIESQKRIKKQIRVKQAILCLSHVPQGMQL